MVIPGREKREEKSTGPDGESRAFCGYGFRVRDRSPGGTTI
jgi:hypothetical protein